MIKPIGTDGEWFQVNWKDIYAKKGMSPIDVPGVVPLDAREPWPYKVHRSHLALLGLADPIGVRTAGGPWAHEALRPHQVVGARFITSRRGTLLADEQRVGKTHTCVYSHNPDDGPLVIVGPLAARAVWRAVCEQRFGVSSFIALSGRQGNVEEIEHDPAKAIFLHFAIVHAWRGLFESFDKIGTLVVDECHLSGIGNRRNQTIEAIRFLNTVAKRVVCASGTPLTNKPSHLWSILDILAPGAFGPYWDYARRYCDAKPTAYGWTANGASNQEELKLRLQEVMLRRTWKEIAPYLPPITRTIEIVPLSDNVRDKVESCAAKIRSQATGNIKTAVGELARLRLLYAKQKIDAAVALAKDNVAVGRSQILWTWHREVAHAVVHQLRNDDVQAFIPDEISGDVPTDEREHIIEACREAAKSRPVILVATMASLATAVNLSFAQHEIFVELDWSPSTTSQAEMRPFDGKQPISATYLVADCDVDQKLADSILKKLDNMVALGLDAGVGDVAGVLSDSIGVVNTQTLSALADAIIFEAGE